MGGTIKPSYLTSRHPAVDWYLTITQTIIYIALLYVGRTWFILSIYLDVYYWSSKIVSEITAWGVRWTGSLHSPKTICAVVVQRLWNGKWGRNKCGATGNRTQGLWLKPPALCHWATTRTDRGGRLLATPPFFLSLYRFKGLWKVMARIVLDLTITIRSSDCGGVPSTGLPMLWFRTLSFMINSVHSNQTFISSCIL